jgi:hypothetical protein
MTKIFQKIKGISFLAATFMLLTTACVDQEFDVPEPANIPVGEINTIADLRQLHLDNNTLPIAFTEDVSVFGVITMDGNSGNIYRTAFLQDETAAVSLRLMSPGGLYEGDSVRINLKGTRLGAYENMLQIDSVHVGNNVVKISTQKRVEPELTDINTLMTTPSMQGKLIRLEGVEFHQNELGQTLADSANLLSMNRILRDCTGNEIIVRTSGYASFANELVPAGNGSIVAILAQFRDDRQLFIRHMDEVQMNDERCPEPGEDMEIITISEIKQLQAQGASSIPANRRLEGVVISDIEYDNHPGQNLFLMDENGDGIALRFASFHEFALGDNLRVLVGSLPIERYAGLLQINNIPLGNGYLLGQAEIPAPTPTTLLNLENNFDDFESTLVYVENVVIPPTSAFEGNINISDGTGTVVLRTYDWASFAQTPVTEGVYNMVAIASYFNGVQLQLRSLSDLEYVGEYDPGQADLITLAELRSLFEDGATSVPANKSVEGIIISDVDNGNIFPSNAFFQDETGGIALRFTANSSFKLGDKIRISVGNIALSEFRGLLQINNIPLGNAQLLSTGNTVEPVVTTIDNLKNNMQTFESTLVRIVDATITGSTTFNGNTTITDSTGSILMFTRSDASFASSAVPSGPVNITAIATVYDNAQITIRNINDVD